MSKFRFNLLILASLASFSYGEPLKTVYSPFTNNFDYITKIDTNTIMAGAGTTVTCSSGTCTIATVSTVTATGKLGIAWEGGGAALTTGTTYWLVIPASGTLTGFILTGLPSGTLNVNVSSSTVFNTNPVSICATQCPQFTTATSSYNYTLGGWSKTLVKDSYLYFILNTASTATQAVLSLEYNKN